MTPPPPTRHLERSLLAEGHRYIAGMDEVGRGALAGPVSVGVVVVDADTGRMPAGLRDSKLLPAHVRERLCRPITRWSVASAVGHAGPEEIDQVGIVAALRLAGMRALGTLRGAQAWPTAVILDGSHDWLTLRGGAADPESEPAREPAPLVQTQVKADMRCAVVAAASVLAKCERDAMMRQRSADYPDYCWSQNKGYSAPAHLSALRMLGPSPWHRRSWALPTPERGVADPLFEAAEVIRAEAGGQ